MIEFLGLICRGLILYFAKVIMKYFICTTNHLLLLLLMLCMVLGQVNGIPVSSSRLGYQALTLETRVRFPVPECIKNMCVSKLHVHAVL